MAHWDPVRYSNKDKSFFERGMQRAFSEGLRVLRKDGIGCVVFAHKTTEGWEALISGILAGGWTVVASWPKFGDSLVTIPPSDRTPAKSKKDASPVN